MLLLAGLVARTSQPRIRGARPGTTVVVLPVGAIEQHGPHLPVAVDTCLVEAIVRRGLELLPAGTAGAGAADHRRRQEQRASRLPGTLTLSAETLGRVWYEIGASVRRAGLRKLLLFNSHGGQPQVMQIVARELRIDHGMLAVAANWFSWGMPERRCSIRSRCATASMAVTIETAMMLAVRPDLVDIAAAADFVPVTVADDLEYPRLRALGAAGLGWQAQDLHARGCLRRRHAARLRRPGRP